MSKKTKEKPQEEKIEAAVKPTPEIQTKPNSEPLGLAGFNFEEFESLPTDASIKTKRELSMIPIKKPNAQQWFQIHPKWVCTWNVVIWKEDQNIFVVPRKMIPECSGQTKSVKFYVGIYPNSGVFLFPIPEADEDGKRNSWHESAEQVVLAARKGWRRMEPDRATSSYRIISPESKLDDPDWPPMSKMQIFEMAFKGAIIDSADHPVLKALRGKQLL